MRSWFMLMFLLMCLAVVPAFAKELTVTRLDNTEATELGPRAFYQSALAIFLAGFFDMFDGRVARLARALRLDDIVIGEVRDMIEQHLPSGAGEQWYAVMRDDGNVIVSRYPILDSWEVNPGYRITAALLDLGASHDEDLLVIACHWRCCTADADRQEEADSIIEFLHDAHVPDLAEIERMPSDGTVRLSVDGKPSVALTLQRAEQGIVRGRGAGEAARQ